MTEERTESVETNGNVAESVKVDRADKAPEQPSALDTEIEEFIEENEQPVRPPNIPENAENIIDDIWAWSTGDGCAYAAHEDFVNLQESFIGVGETFDDAVADLQGGESTATEPNEATAVLPLDPNSLGNSPADMGKIIDKINEIIING